MDGDMISRAEHEEFRRRMEEAHKRQDKRIADLEKSTDQINSLTISVNSLAQSIKSMCLEQKTQGQRLEALEGQDGEKWRKFIGYVLSTLVGLVLGYIAKQAGII